MKNIIKIIIAVMLAAILCFGSLTATASESHSDLKWNHYDYGSGMFYYEYYEYIGTVIEGQNELDLSNQDSYSRYVIFNAEKSGYYCVEDFPEIKVPADVVDGVAYGKADFEDMGDKFIYLDAGENIFGFEGYFSYGNEEKIPLNIHYLGESITDITYADGAFSGVVENYDIYFAQDADDPYARVGVTDLCVKFSESEVGYDYLWIGIEKDSETGEFFIAFLDYKEPVQLDICKATDIVKSIEITNPDECTVAYNYYTGSYEPKAVPAGIKITFTDGSTAIYENTNSDTYFSCEVEAPNGKVYYVFTGYEYADETVYFVVYFANEEIVRYEIKREDAGVCDNLEEFNDNNGFRVEGAFNDIVYRLKKAFYPENGLSLGDRLDYLSGIFGACTNAVFQIFCNFIELLDYYF